VRGAILCYSVTGNTSLVAQRVAQTMPFAFEVVDITSLPDLDLATFDVVGFAVPTDFWESQSACRTTSQGCPTSRSDRLSS
jgi:flavodoxin